MAFVDLGFEEIVKLAEFINFFESASKSIHKLNQKWWVEPLTGAPKFNHGEKFMLMVSEISEAMEGQRQGKMDDKLPHRPMVEVELADAIIRILDYSGISTWTSVELSTKSCSTTQPVRITPQKPGWRLAERSIDDYCLH